jgi:hypothetical protein
MSFVIHYTHAYAFLGGLFISKFTNMFSDIVISGLVIYIVTPEKYNENNWNRLKSYYNNLTGFLTSKLHHNANNINNSNMIENTPNQTYNTPTYNTPTYNIPTYNTPTYQQDNKKPVPDFVSNNPYKLTSLPKIETMGK